MANHKNLIADLRRVGMNSEADELVSLQRRLDAQKRELARIKRENRLRQDLLSYDGDIRMAAYQRYAEQVRAKRSKAEREDDARRAMRQLLAGYAEVFGLLATWHGALADWAEADLHLIAALRAGRGRILYNGSTFGGSLRIGGCSGATKREAGGFKE